jgi:hypothetical protein
LVAATVIVMHVPALAPSSPWQHRRELTNLVVHAGVKKNPLGGGRLAGINVRGNADIAVVFNGGSADINYSGFRKPTKPGRFSAGRLSLVGLNVLETSG